MFERGIIDNSKRQQEIAVPAHLELSDGSALAGSVLVAQSHDLYGELNGAGAFIHFEAVDGERRIISKAAIKSVQPIEFPSTDQLERRIKRVKGANPYQLLGVKQSDDDDTIRRAYHSLAKAYHPDRFAGVDLPTEVSDYLSSVVRRLNAAYAMVQQRFA